MNGKKALVVLVCCFIFLGFPLAGESTGLSTSSAALANYRTALRCYQQSKKYVEKAEWENAFSQAELGLTYDDTISDLWFVSAYAAHRLGKNPAELLPSLKKAMERDKWVDYNKDGALLLYAELLTNTGESRRALVYLEEGKVFPSSSREYIKILSYYRMGTEDSYTMARELVSEASRLYPDDMRFPQAFFTYELQVDLTYSPEAEGLGRIFAQRFEEMGEFPAELYLSSAVFAEPALKVRILQSFNASGKRHPMYAVLALKEGLLSESQAYEYFCTFASETISLTELELFVNTLQDDSTKSAMIAYLNGYQGVLTHDYTGDRIADLFVQYSRGRPQQIRFDRNQDGVDDWIARCDFGVPTELTLPEAQVSLFYKKYPFVNSMEIQTIDLKFVDNALEWSPVAITAYEPLANALAGARFFVPQLKSGQDSLFPTMRQLVDSAYAVAYPVAERDDARIEISVLDGQVRSAQYFQGHTLYAQLACEDGIPRSRNVDIDGDGWFELTQNFGFSPRNYLDYVSPAESLDLYDSLFGYVFFPHGIYIRQALLDRDLDMDFDFGEEYTSGRGVVSTWGNPLSDDWAVQYVREGGTTNSRALFKMPHSSDLVSVYVENTIPVRVTLENSQGLPYRDLTITPVEGVYWLGEAGSAEMSAHLQKTLEETGEQGRSMVVQMDAKEFKLPADVRFSAVKISDFYFGVLLDE